MHFITPQLARDAWQNPLSFRLGGKTPYFAFWFSTWRKTSHIYLFIYLFHREKLVLEQSETSSCVKSCCSCLFTRVLELQPAVLGMLSVAKIEVKRLGVSAQVAERIACAGCAQVCLCSGVAVLRSPRSRWDCPQDSPHRLAPSPVCSCIPGCKQPTGSCLPQEMPAATDEHWMKGNVLGEHMAFSWSWTSAGLSLVLPCSKNPAVTRLELPGVMSLNWVDFSMHIYKQVDKHFLNPAKLLTFASEMVFFSEML